MEIFFTPRIATAIAVYITVVGIVYNTLLRRIWNPQGWDKVADELLHLVIPLLFIIYWLLAVPKGELRWRNTFALLVYPLAYFIWVLIFGALRGWYPYPFIDVNQLGYSATLLHSGILTIGFLLLSQLFVAAAALTRKRRREI